MARRSSIELDPKVRAEVDAALVRGLTIDDITATIRDMGAEHSRSAIGRYAKKYREIVDRERDMKAVAAAMSADFGTENNPVGKLLIQLMTSLTTRAVLDASEEDSEIDGKEVHFLARAVKDTMSAAKIDTDRDKAIRDEERKIAADKAETAGRSAGASDAQIAAIRRSILGLKE